MTETRKSKRLQLLERGITKEVRMNESVNYLDYANRCGQQRLWQ